VLAKIASFSCKEKKGRLWLGNNGSNNYHEKIWDRQYNSTVENIKQDRIQSGVHSGTEIQNLANPGEH